RPPRQGRGRPPRHHGRADGRGRGARLGRPRPAAAVLRRRARRTRARGACAARAPYRESGARPAHPQRGAGGSVTALARAEERAERLVLVDGLVVRFGEVEAVAGVSFDVGGGEVFGLLGPNGAGKTTTIPVLTTLLRPTAGSAFVAAQDVVREGLAVRQAIGYVPQAISIDGALTAYENLEFYGRATGVPRRERGARIEEAVEAMRLESFLDRL